MFTYFSILLWQDQMCLMVADMLEFVPVNKDLRLTAGTGHKLQLAYSETLGLYIGVYLHAPKQGQVLKWLSFVISLLLHLKVDYFYNTWGIEFM